MPFRLSDVPIVVRISLIVFAALTSAVLTGLQGPPESATAAFPGANGKIAYERNHDIYVVNRDGSGDAPLITGAGSERAPAWSGDGRMIAFVRDLQIWVADADGSNQRQLTHVNFAFGPSWSPDGTRIAFQEGNLPGHLSMVDVTTGTVTALTEDDSFGVIGRPDWSPDGTMIALPAGDSISQVAIWVIPLDGAATQVKPPGNGLQVSWSPDGIEIAFQAFGIQAVHVNSGEIRTIAAGVDASGFAWSPDGSFVVYTPTAGSDSDGMVIVRADGGGVAGQVSSGVAFDPAWQPMPGPVHSVEFTQGIQELQTVTQLKASLGTETVQPSAFPGENGKIAFESDRMGVLRIFSQDPGISEATQLTDQTGSQPRWSPDGRRIAYGGPGGIWVTDADGGNGVKITEGLGGEPAWSPDGNKIVFSRQQNIFVVNSDGGNELQLTNQGVDRAPDWSPDGSKIAFVRRAPDYFHIYVMDSNGANQKPLTPPQARTASAGGDARGQFAAPAGVPIADFDPVWSPDGTKIAFHRTGELVAMARIWVVDANGGEPTQLPGSGNNMSPAWSPDGQQIAFASDRDGNLEIYVMDANGVNQTRLTNNPARDSAPDWQPKPPGAVHSVEFTQGIQELQTVAQLKASLGTGTVQPSAFPGTNGKIAYQPVGSGIHTVESDGTAESVLTQGQQPTWSRDGHRLAFVGLAGGVWVINEDGSGLEQLADTGGHPSWSADGSRLAYVHGRELRVMNSDGGGNTTIFTSAEDETVNRPRWSPDGDVILFGTSGVLATQWMLRSISADGSGLTTIANGRFGDWSPDGERIVFIRFVEGNQELTIANADGSDPQQVIEFFCGPGERSDSTGGGEVCGSTRWPTWSPDGTRILFHGSPLGAGGWSLFVANPDGSGLDVVVAGPVIDIGSDWQSQPPGIIHGVEFTQGIQELQTVAQLQSDTGSDGKPPVPIVGDKPGVMRVYFDEVDEVTPYVVKVSGFPDVNVILEPGCTAAQRRKQEDDCVSVDFYFVREAGPWELTLGVEGPFGELVEEHEFNLTLVETEPLEIVAVEVCDGSGCGVPADLAATLGLLRATYPGTVDLTISASNVTRATANGNAAWWNKVLTDLKALRAADGVTGDVYYHGAVRMGAGGFTGAGILGMGYQPGFEGATRLGTNATDIDGGASPATEQVVAHEVGHNLGRMHVPTVAGTTCYGTPTGLDANWPHPNPLIHEVGFDVATGKVRLDDDYTDIMAYCLPGWISTYQYNAILDSVTVPAGSPASPQSAAPGTFWEISGSIDETSATLDPLFNVETTGDTGPGEGSHRIEVRDSGNGLLFTRMFEPSGGHWAGIAEVKGFSELIPVQAGAAHIAVFDAFNTMLAELELGSEAPVVSFNDVAPAGAGGDTVDASWTVTDPDSANHSYRLDYSKDGGITWKTLIPYLDEASVSLDTETLPGTAQMQLRVQASDGASTGSATSNVFEVSKHAPYAEIISPEGGSFAVGQVVWLEAVAYDADDGTLEGGAVSWSSSRDGTLGTGASLPVTDLSAGSHTITLTAEDSDANEAMDSIEITVAEASLNEGSVSGDVDCNGVVNSVDGLKILQSVAGLPVQQTQPCPQIGSGEPPFGDVNCDGAVGAGDALFVLRHVAALPVNLPPGCAQIGARVRRRRLVVELVDGRRGRVVAAAG